MLYLAPVPVLTVIFMLVTLPFFPVVFAVPFIETPPSGDKARMKITLSPRYPGLPAGKPLISGKRETHGPSRGDEAGPSQAHPAGRPGPGCRRGLRGAPSARDLGAGRCVV